jgi:hypothetical protein
MSEQEHSKYLKTVLKETPKEFLACRDIRHLWTIVDEFHIVEETVEGKYLERGMECTRCKTRKIERHLLRTDRWGIYRMVRVSSGYSYPEHYLIPEMTRTDHGTEILRAERFLQTES